MRGVTALTVGVVLGVLGGSAVYEWRQREEAWSPSPPEAEPKPVRPRGHLEPCTAGVWNGFGIDYEIGVKNELGLAWRYWGGTRFQMIVLPSFSPEYAVTLTEGGSGGHTLAASEAQDFIWVERDFLGRRRRPGPLRIEQSEAMIPVDVSKRVRAAILPYLFDTHYPDEFTGGLDGTTYVFTAFVGGRGILCGEVWSPEGGTAGSDLVALGEALRTAAHAPSHDASSMASIILKLADKLAAQAPAMTKQMTGED